LDPLQFAVVAELSDFCAKTNCIGYTNATAAKDLVFLTTCVTCMTIDMHWTVTYLSSTLEHKNHWMS